MGVCMYGKAERQAALLRLIAAEKPRNQAEIVRLMHEKGYEVTQASISRDVRELGFVKVQGRYLLSGAVSASVETWSDIGHIGELITAIEPVGANLVVLRTTTGAASPVALDIDGRGLADVAGTIAGDDTVFVAVRSRSAQGRMIALLKGVTGRRRNGETSAGAADSATAEAAVGQAGRGSSAVRE